MHLKTLQSTYTVNVHVDRYEIKYWIFIRLFYGYKLCKILKLKIIWFSFVNAALHTEATYEQRPLLAIPLSVFTVLSNKPSYTIEIINC